MKLAIYGAGRCGEHVMQELLNAENAKVACHMFIDNNPMYFGKIKCGVPIINEKDFISFYSKQVDGVLVAVANVMIAQEMVLSLLQRGFNNIYIMPVFSAFGVAELPVLDRGGILYHILKCLMKASRFCHM